MEAKLIISACGCGVVKQYIPGIFVEDSGLLPFTDINIGWLRIDGDVYPINKVFASKSDLVAYLNGVFQTDNNITLEGVFAINSGKINYRNNENFNEIEIMAIYQNYQTVFAMGNAPEVNTDVVAIDNNPIIIHDSLVGVEILNVAIGNIVLEPLTVGGWLHNSETGTLDLGGTYKDVNIYVLYKQVPA